MTKLEAVEESIKRWKQRAKDIIDGKKPLGENADNCPLCQTVGYDNFGHRYCCKCPLYSYDSRCKDSNSYGIYSKNHTAENALAVVRDLEIARELVLKEIEEENKKVEQKEKIYHCTDGSWCVSFNADGIGSDFIAFCENLPGFRILLSDLTLPMAEGVSVNKKLVSSRRIYDGRTLTNDTIVQDIKTGKIHFTRMEWLKEVK